MDTWQSLTANQQKAVLISLVFAIYIFLIFIFAIFYAVIYHRHRSYFSFATPIEEGQRDQQLLFARTQIERLSTAHKVLNEATGMLANGPQTDFRPNRWQLRTQSGSMRWISVHGGKFNAWPFVIFDNSKPERSGPLIYSHIYFFHPTQKIFKRYSLADLKRDIANEIAKVNGDVLKRRVYERNLAEGLESIWTFADFFYFSAIVQSTVGLGDIQPNNTSVRILVVLQILLGYAILVVLLNVILSWA